jgi:hypothetical protein
MASAAQAPPSRCAVVPANRLCNNGRQEPAGRRQRVVHGAQSAGTRLVEPHRRGAAAALRNHALWIKMRILFYRLDGVDNGALFQTAATPAPSPEGGAAAPVTSETFLMWHYVGNADFENMAMTRTGTVVFPSHTGAWVLLDQEALDTGKLLLCEFGNNGRLAANRRLRPWFMYEFWTFNK